jgi:hypothetical protein
MATRKQTVGCATTSGTQPDPSQGHGLDLRPRYRERGHHESRPSDELSQPRMLRADVSHIRRSLKPRFNGWERSILHT